MVRLLNFVVLLCISFVHASLSSLNGTSIPTLDASDSSSSGNTRTLWDIIWNCALTLFACTWTAVHLNIPHIEEGKVIGALRRLLVMFFAMIAPELMVAWSAQQYFSARRTADDFNHALGAQPHDRMRGFFSFLFNYPWNGSSTEWTTTHGFFAWMGGFMLYVDNEPRATLTPDELLQFIEDGYVEMPDITEADINDRSKGDVLSKCIAIFQLVWFTIQIVARHVQNLPITLLEIDTLGVAVLASVAYLFWLKKPKDVGRPHTVYWKKCERLPDKLTYEFCYQRRSLLLNLVLVMSGTPASGSVPYLGGYSRAHHFSASISIGCISGMIFGAIHCMGWNYLFQRQLAWRVCSILVSTAPLLVLFFLIIAILYTSLVVAPDQVSAKLLFWDKLRFVVMWCCYMLIYHAYVCARLALIILMLLDLRSLPTGVYDTVAWTKLITHY